MTAKKTKADIAAEMIKNDILSGNIAPKTQLKIQDISKKYKIGSTPIREALNKLTQTGLIEEKPLKGFFVTPLSSHEIQDLFKIRRLIEIEAFKLAMKNGDDAWEGSVISEAHQLKKMLKNHEQHTLEEISSKGAKLWSTMMSACGSPTLMKIQKKLWEQCQRYTDLWWQEKLDNKNIETSLSLLQKKADVLIENILNKDEKKVVEILNKDFDQFLKQYLQFLNSYSTWLKSKNINLNN